MLAPCGVSIVNSYRLFDPFAADVKFDNGLLYAQSAVVIDPEAGNYAGRFDRSGFGLHLLLPEARAGRVYAIASRATDGAALSLRVYDLNTFLLAGSLDLPPVFGEPSTRRLGSLVRWGARGLAFSGNDGKVYILEHELVGGTLPSFTPAPPPPAPTVDITGGVSSIGGA